MVSLPPEVMAELLGIVTGGSFPLIIITEGAVWGPPMTEGASDMMCEADDDDEEDDESSACWLQLREQSSTSSSWSWLLKRCLHWAASTFSPVCWATHFRRRECSRVGSQTPFLSTHDDHCDHSLHTTRLSWSARLLSLLAAVEIGFVCSKTVVVANQERIIVSCDCFEMETRWWRHRAAFSTYHFAGARQAAPQSGRRADPSRGSPRAR